MSYRILTANDVVCDSTNPANGVINPVLKQVVNKVWSFEFTLAPGHPFYNKILEQSTEIGVQLDDDDPIFWGTVYGTKTDFYGQKTVLVEDMLGYFNHALMSPYRYNSQNISDILTLAVTQYNAQCTDKPIELGSVTTTHTAHNLGWSSNYETVLDMLMANVIGKNGGYIRMRYDLATGKRYLDYSEDYGDTLQTIRIGSNLIDFIKDSDASNLVSVLIPLGARLPDNEQTVEGVDLRLTIETDQRQTDRIEDNTLILEIGRKVKARIWDSVDDPDTLYTVGSNWLANQFKDITIEAKAFDLNLADEQIEAIRLYDEVRIISEPHNLDTRFPVLELTMNLNNPASNVLTLGKTVQPGITQTTIETADKINEFPSYVDVQADAARRAAEVLESATNGYIKFVYNDTTGILEQILIKDLTDPDNNWWRIGLGGIGYTSDGGASYDVAMTRLGQLVSYFAIIGGWEVNSYGLYKVVSDPLDPTKQYMVTIYTPNTSTPGTSPIFDFKYSSDGGQSFSQMFYIAGNGSIYVYGSSASDVRFQLINSANPSQYVQLSPRSLSVLSPILLESADYLANWLANGFDISNLTNGDSIGLSNTSGLLFSSTGGVKRGQFKPTDFGVGHTTVTTSENVTWDVFTVGDYKICILSKSAYCLVQHAWNNIYCGTPSQSSANFPKVKLPYTFDDEPFCFAQLSSDGSGDGWLVTNVDYSPSGDDVYSYTPAYDVARGTSGTPTLTINYLVIGKV